MLSRIPTRSVAGHLPRGTSNESTLLDMTPVSHAQLSGATHLVVFDCDSTLIQDEVIELLAETAGTRDLVAKVTERAMRGEIDFATSLVERVATLRGVSESVFEDVYRNVRVSPGAPELIARIHELGGSVAVVSGGFHEVLDPLANDLQVDVWRANRLEVVHGKLTGRTVGPIIDGNAKAAALSEWAEAAGVRPEHTIAIGDGANDIPMMRRAGLSVAFNAKPIVRQEANVQVDHDLSDVIPHLENFLAAT